MRIHSKRGVQAFRRPAVHGLAVVGIAAILSGCGGDSPTSTQVDPTLAVAAASQAGGAQKVLEGRVAAEAVQAPFSTAAGDLEGLGDVGLGSDDLGEYGRVGKLVATAASGVARPRLGDGARRAAGALGAVAKGAADSCVTTEQPGGATLTVCIVPTGTPNVARVTIVRHSPLELVRTTVQVFRIDTNGTPAQSDDDHILDYHSQVTLRDGTTADLDMTPHGGGAIIDHSVVDIVERVRPAHGVVLEQSNALRTNVGLVGTDGDEVVLDLASNVSFRDGAGASLALVDGDPEDGIADDDHVDVVTQFTAAPANPWLQTVTSTVGLLVHHLADESDDQVDALARTTVFDGVTAAGGSPTGHTSFAPSEPVGRGDEPCGGHFERHATFPIGWNRRTLDLVIDRTCAGSGNATLDVTFADATATHGTTTWDAAGNATSTTNRRDGAVVTGVYTAANHRLVVDTTYPGGRDPVSEHLEAQGDPETGSGDLLATRTHTGGSIDSLVAHAVSHGDSTETIAGHSVDARGRVDFTMDIDRRTRVVNGANAGPADETLTYTLAPQAEADGWLLVFLFRDPSEELTVAGAILLDGDGSGCGTLTVTSHGHTGTVPVCFDADGGGTIGGSDGPVPF